MELLDLTSLKTYVSERECDGGGYCFYRLEEPSLADTFYALETIKLICSRAAASNKTLDYVEGFFAQPLRKGFLWGATYAARILARLDHPIPRKEELKALLELYLEWVTDIPATGLAQNILELTYATIETLVCVYGCVGKRIAEKLGSSLASLESPDGGFGIPPNLTDTFLVVGMLHMLEQHPKEWEKTVEFVHSCEDEQFGFTNVPSTKPGFLEGLFYGLSLCDIFHIVPTYKEAAAQFVISCQTSGGGFRRASLLGIPTLEYTYMAVCSLALLGVLGQVEPTQKIL